MKINEIDHPTKIENDVIMSVLSIVTYVKMTSNLIQNLKKPNPNPNIEMKS